ncbi:MAG: isoprenoid biosynthesis glyoxalase ElbB [Alphaproteobacteria bacterium]|nr:isoprenoid biosynthesis glyoxalase ElbB [Alphaproteobacteria bacterium]
MEKNPHFAVILSGCGRADGSEIHEAVFALLCIENMGCTYQCFAPNIKQAAVINHLNNQTMPEQRNVLIEAARIARGNILDIQEFNHNEFDGIIFPGGLGAITNWCDFASKGTECTVNTSIRSVIRQCYDHKIVIGAMCIAPVLIALVLADKKIHFTLGAGGATAAKLEQLGAVHEEVGVTDVCIDRQNRICSTPAYMLATNMLDVCQGAQNMIGAMCQLIKESA